MATVNIAYGTRTEFASDTNLNSLTSGQCKMLGVVANSATLADGFKIDATIVLATTGVTSTGTLTFYLVESADGTNYTDGVSTSTTADQTVSIKNAPVVQYVQANSSSQGTVRVVFDLPKQFAPKYFGILVSNGSGATLSSSGNSVYYTPITYTVA